MAAFDLRNECQRNIHVPPETCAGALRARARLTRRLLAFVASALFALGWASAAAGAEEHWPAHPLRVIVPYGVGGSYDAIARVMANQLSDQLGQQLIVDNRAGAAGRIGMDLAVKAPPTGYTLVVIGNSQAIVPSVHVNVPYNLERDFAYVSMVASVPNALLLQPAVPAQTIAEFVALAKAKPGTLRWGSGGTGSSGHLACELFRSMTGADIVHVPYKGAALAITALLANEVQAYVSNLVNAVPQVQAGKLRALAVTGLNRAAALPNVPTLNETVAKGYDMVEFHGIAAPKGTPPAIVTRLNREIAKALASADTRTRFAQQGADPAPSTPQAFERFVLAEQAKYAGIVRSIGMKPEG
jgi:tripartite-type tricarboxylate transporter receptor subunit TctC